MKNSNNISNPITPNIRYLQVWFFGHTYIYKFLKPLVMRHNLWLLFFMVMFNLISFEVRSQCVHGTFSGERSWNYTDIPLSANSLDYSSFDYIADVGISLAAKKIHWGDYLIFEYKPVITYLNLQSGRSFYYEDFVGNGFDLLKGEMYARIKIPGSNKFLTETTILQGDKIGEISCHLISSLPVSGSKDYYEPVCNKLEKKGVSCTRTNLVNYDYEPVIEEITIRDAHVSGLKEYDKIIGKILKYEKLVTEGTYNYNRDCNTAVQKFKEALKVIDEVPEHIIDNVGLDVADIKKKMEECGQRIEKQKKEEEWQRLFKEGRKAERQGNQEQALARYQEAKDIKETPELNNSIQSLKKELEDHAADPEENSQTASGSIPQNSEQERARQQAIDEQANRSSNSDREREEWESDYQQRVQSMLDEMDRQSQIEAQIREQKREAMDAAVTKVAGMINQIQQQNRARKKRNRHRFIKNELSKEIEWQSRMFDKEADAYKKMVKRLKYVLDRYGQDIDKKNIDRIVNEMDEAIEKVKEIQKQKVSFLDQMERDFEGTFMQIKDRYYNTQPSREEVQSYIKVKQTSFSEVSNSVGFSRFDLEYLLSQISIDYDYGKLTSENAIYEIAEIARDLDMHRPSVEEPSYGYYGYYTAYLPNGEKKLVDKIERNDSTPVELLALYGKYFPEGAHRAKIGDLIMKIAKDNKSVEVLEVYLKYYEDGQYAEKARELKPKFANWDRVQKQERLAEYRQRYKKTEKKWLKQQAYGFLAAYVTSTGSVAYGLSILTDPKNEISGGDETLAYTSFGVGIVSAVIGGILLRKSKYNENRASDYKEKIRSLEYDLEISAIPNANHFDRTALLTLRFNF